MDNLSNNQPPTGGLNQWAGDSAANVTGQPPGTAAGAGGSVGSPGGVSPLEADPDAQSKPTPLTPPPSANPEPEKDDFLESILKEQPTETPSTAGGAPTEHDALPNQPPDFPPPAGETSQPPEIQGSFEKGGAGDGSGKIKGVILALVVLAVLGGGGWFAYNYLTALKTPTPSSAPATPQGGNQPPAPPVVSAPPVSQPATPDAARKQDLVALQKAVDDYFKDNGKYPVSVALSKTDDPQTPLLILVPKYIAKVSVDPQVPTRFYGYKATETNYEISAVFDEKQGDSDIKLETGYLVVLKPGVTLGTAGPAGQPIATPTTQGIISPVVSPSPTGSTDTATSASPATAPTGTTGSAPSGPSTLPK